MRNDLWNSYYNNLYKRLIKKLSLWQICVMACGTAFANRIKYWILAMFKDENSMSGCGNSFVLVKWHHWIQSIEFYLSNLFLASLLIQKRLGFFLSIMYCLMLSRLHCHTHSLKRVEMSIKKACVLHLLFCLHIYFYIMLLIDPSMMSQKLFVFTVICYANIQRMHF